MQSLSNFCSVNELEKSMSYIERTAKKLLPILIEVKKRMIPDKKKKKNSGKQDSSKRKTGANGFKGNQIEDQSDTDEDDMVIDLGKASGKGKKKQPQFDLKNILGYLN